VREREVEWQRPRLRWDLSDPAAGRGSLTQPVPAEVENDGEETVWAGTRAVPARPYCRSDEQTDDEPDGESEPQYFVESTRHRGKNVCLLKVC